MRKVAELPLVSQVPQDGKVVHEMKHEGAVSAVAVRPDGKRFASAGTNGVARLWNAADGKLVATLKGDRYADEWVAETDRALTVARSDVEFRRKSLEAAEAADKKQAERVAKAAETNLVTEKVFAEKEKALKEAETARVNAQKGLSDLLAEIQRVTEAFEKAVLE